MIRQSSFAAALWLPALFSCGSIGPVFAVPPHVIIIPPPSAHTSGTRPGYVRPEARAMWVVRYSLLTPADVHAVVERAFRYHFNALMVQVRGRGDAYYNSPIEPRARELAGEPLSFDPLAQITREAHGRGIKVFAWMNTCLVWSGAAGPSEPGHIVNRHPEWVDSRLDGTFMSGTNYEGQFLNPGIVGVRHYTVALCRDIVRRYDIDGLHLDYIRYPGPDMGYNTENMQRFYTARHRGVRYAINPLLRAEVMGHPAAWAAWRQQQVTELVKEIGEGIRQEKPWISLSAAVWANLADARYKRMQDWPTWLRKGLVDFVCPMAYSTNTTRVANQIRQAVQLSHGRQIWAGLGAWQMSEPQTAAKIQAVRRLGASGICLFSYGGVTKDGTSESYLALLEHGPFQRAAKLPRMPWLPEPPINTAQARRSLSGS